jgi:membrane protein implicated in regulation of membrane protease activity
MLIVAVAWIYVVGLMALTEPSVVGAIMTFVFYCMLPLSLVYYIAGRKGRRRANKAPEPPAPNTDEG